MDLPNDVRLANPCNFLRSSTKELVRQSPDRDLTNSQEERELSALMRKTQGGDQGAYRQLLGRLVVLVRTNVRNSLHRMGMSDAASEEDVVQDVLLAIHGKRDTYDPSLFFLPWFYAIVRYKVIDFGRSLRRSKSESFDETKMSQEDQLGEIEFSRDRAGDQLDLNGELQKLPRKQREILTLAKLEGLSLEEISIQTGFSISDVKVNVHRAIKSLRKNLKEPDSENR